MSWKEWDGKLIENIIGLFPMNSSLISLAAWVISNNIVK